MTNTRGRTNASGEVHVLDFTTGDENGCGLTILVKDFRFHIIADAEKLAFGDGNEDSPSRRCRSLLEAVQVASKEEGRDDKEPKNETDEDSYQPTTVSKRTFVDGEIATTHKSPSNDSDSGVDIAEGSQQGSDVGQALEALQQWMLEPFSEIFEQLPTVDDGYQQSIHEWYTGSTYFYKLEVKGNMLVPIEVDSQTKLEDRIRKLTPRLLLPKYIRSLDIPWYNAEDISVISASDDPSPYHPCRVSINDQVHFFKAVDNTQPQPTKRELKLMKEIERKDLHKKIRVPLVTGLVRYEDSTTEIMGFLQTAIHDPTPLTLMLDSDIVEDERDKWAADVEHMVQILHENDIIWGDAKADNFVVDRHGDLWIIDFGGSYTDGWVDPDLMETEEGDDMGLEKITNALLDPDTNTYDPTSATIKSPSSGKRSREAERSQELRRDPKRQRVQ